MNDVVAALFERERDLPYAIPLAPAEPDNTCIGKHLRLAQVLRSHGFAVRFRIARFRWSDLPLPEHVLEVPRVNDSTHMYLEVENGQRWSIVDATWDRGLASLFLINEWHRDMSLAVPCLGFFSLEQSQRCADELSLPSIEIDNTANKAFFLRLNQWLEEIRRQKPLS